MAEHVPAEPVWWIEVRDDNLKPIKVKERLWFDARARIWLLRNRRMKVQQEETPDVVRLDELEEYKRAKALNKQPADGGAGDSSSCICCRCANRKT